LEIANGDILVSYDVSSLFTNVPLDETIQLLANRAFTNNWLNWNSLKCCNLHDLIYIFLDNGVMTTPKRRILSFVFTVLCLNESYNI